MIGILALQGCVAPHEAQFSRLQIPTLRVRRPEHLAGIRGLVLPGGESTTMWHLIELFGFEAPLLEKAKEIPFWGVCAGAILMAKELAGPSQGPKQRSLNVMDLVVERNAYGRQLESFTGPIRLIDGREENSTFIRAPRFVRWGETVTAKGFRDKDAVFLESDRHMVTAFHPELSENSFFHRYFYQKTKA